MQHHVGVNPYSFLFPLLRSKTKKAKYLLNYLLTYFLDLTKVRGLSTHTYRGILKNMGFCIMLWPFVNVQTPFYVTENKSFAKLLPGMFQEHLKTFLPSFFCQTFCHLLCQIVFPVSVVHMKLVSSLNEVDNILLLLTLI